MNWIRPVLSAAAAAACLSPGAPAGADIVYEETVRVAGAEVHRETTLCTDSRRIATRAIAARPRSGSSDRGGDAVEITRLDREVVWRLDPATKSYREYSFDRVRELARATAGESTAGPAQPLKALYHTDPPTITMERPQPGLKIAGFDTERVQATMEVALQNVKSGSRAIAHFSTEVWLTRDARILEEVQRFEEPCSKKLGTTESLGRLQTGAGPWMDALVPHVRVLERRIAELGGFPLKSTMTAVWEALPAHANERATRTAIGTFSTEVTAVRLDRAANGLFDLPGDYQPAGALVKSAAQPPAASSSAALNSSKSSARRGHKRSSRERLGGKRHRSRKPAEDDPVYQGNRLR